MSLQIRIYLIVYFAMFVLFVDDYRIRDFDEAVYLNATEIMRTKSSYLIPEYYWGEIRTNKPIGLYWTVLTGQYVFGENLFGARMISIVAAFFTLLFTYKIGRLLFSDEKKAEMALIVLSATPFFFHMTWLIKPEMALVSFITISHYFLLKILQSHQPTTKDIIAFYATMGLGFMIKGPPAVIFPLLTAIVYHLVHRESPWATILLSLKGWMVFVVIVFPWYLFLLNEFGWEYFLDTFNREIIQRITYNNQSYSQPLFLLTFLPWIGVILMKVKWKNPREQYFNISELYRFPLAWIASTLLFIVLFVREYHNHYSLDYVVPVALIAGGLVAMSDFKRLFIGIFLISAMGYLGMSYYLPESIIDTTLLLIGCGLLSFSALAIYLNQNIERVASIAAVLVVVNLWFNYLWIQPNMNISPLNRFISDIKADAGDLAVSNRLINIDFSFFWWYLNGKAGSTYYPERKEFMAKLSRPSKNLKYAICTRNTFEETHDLYMANWVEVNSSFFYQDDYHPNKSSGLAKATKFIRTGDVNQLFSEYVLLARRSDSP